MLDYKLIEVFVTEEARWRGSPLSVELVARIRELKIAARVIVSRGSEGCNESGEVATSRLELFSHNMPLRITIALPAAELERVLPLVEEMVSDGIVGVHDLQVIAHKTKGRLLARDTRVEDIMTPKPQAVNPATTLSEVARLLLDGRFTGVPVIDGQRRPVGVITQGDLIYKAGMSMRLSLLGAWHPAQRDAALEPLAGRQAQEIMTRPAVTISRRRVVTHAVSLMLEKGVKRLPVTDEQGVLVGMVSRSDIFRAVARSCPDWSAFQRQHIRVAELRSVADISRRDVHTVAPDTPIEQVLRIIDCNDIQRVCVVDAQGRLLGLISDRDLLAAFSEPRSGLRDVLARGLPFGPHGRDKAPGIGGLAGKTAADLMRRDVMTVSEQTSVAAAIQLMLTRQIKRLPVLDAQGRFTGMISRDALLRAGFAHEEQADGGEKPLTSDP